MEGYTNVSGNHEDFDDLNIESRNTLDGDETKEKNELEVQRLRNIKVQLDDGGFGYVFSVKSERWRCHLCDVVVISQKHVETHVQSKKHQIKMTLPSHPPELFARVENKKSAVEIPKLAPGEPVPPGFEDVVKRVTQIQATLDSHVSSPLIGLEYLVELAPDERGKEPMYICMLCDKKGDPRVVMAHLTSYNHRAKYIGIYYPTANKALFNEFPRTKEGKKGMLEIVTRICTKIEEKYGRLQPLVVEKEVFETRKDQIIKQITEEQHFRETPDETFVELIDVKVLEELAAQEEEPEVEIIRTAENKSTFNKGKISCDRSRLRTRDEDDNTEEESKLKHSVKGSKEPSSKKLKLHSANLSRKSLSSISSLSSSSCSRSRSRSRSKSRSRSGSYARSRYGYHGWKEGKYNRGGWSRSRRSRSGSRGRRHFRSDSRSRSRRSRSYSPGSRYGRRVSPADSPSRSRYRYGRPGSPKYSRYHDNYNDKYNKYREKPDRKDPHTEEKSKWEKFRQEVGKIEHELTKNLKFHEKNPEKHPMYPEEWKKFWNRRYKELQAQGEDPSKHDFKPEWVEFWNKRLKEMHEEELKNKKEELKLKIGLPKEEEVQQPRIARKKKLVQEPDIIDITSGKEDEASKKDVTVTDIKNTWKAFTGSDIKGTTKRSPSPWEEEKIQRGSPSRRPQRGGAFSRGRGRGGRIYGYHREESGSCGVVSVLRLLTAMENQLGSLGPRVNTLLATALSMDKARTNSSAALLSNSENVVLLETVKEKLRGQLFAGIVERNMVIASRSCVQKLENLLAKAEEVSQSVTPSLSVPSKSVEPLPSASVSSSAAEPVTVPGVGTVDKVAIAQQIASALVAQGKTDVSQEELEQLINAVVGMAQASVDSEHPVSTAAFVSQLQQQQQQSSDKKYAIKFSNALEEKSPLQKLLSVVASGKNNTSDVKSNQSRVSALQLLQSAYEEPKKLGLKDLLPFFKNQFSSNKSGMTSGQFMSTSECMEDLSEDDLKTLLQNFKDLSSEEQQGLISYLKKLETKEPDRVEKLRQFVNLEGCISQNTFHNIKETLNPSGTSISKSDRLGRLSPFSLRHGGINPSQEFGNVFSNKDMENQRKSLKLDDSDDDYSFEDIYAAASKKVKEREKAKEEEEARMKQLTESNKLKEERDVSVSRKSDDPTIILRETKEMIANIMGQLPSKFMQKQGGSPRRGSPAMQGHHTRIGSEMKPLTSGPEISGQKIQALGSETVPPSRPAQSVPTLEDSRCLNQIYPNADPSYASQFGKQQQFPVGTQNYSENRQSFPTQQPVYSGEYEQNRQFDDRYLGNSHQQYPQQAGGTYTVPFTNQASVPFTNQASNTGGWTQYTEQYGQQQTPRNPLPGGPFTRYPYQPTYY